MDGFVELTVATARWVHSRPVSRPMRDWCNTDVLGESGLRPESADIRNLSDDRGGGQLCATLQIKKVGGDISDALDDATLKSFHCFSAPINVPKLINSQFRDQTFLRFEPVSKFSPLASALPVRYRPFRIELVHSPYEAIDCRCAVAYEVFVRDVLRIAGFCRSGSASMGIG